MGTGIAPLPAHPGPHHPGYTSPPDYWHVHGCTGHAARLNMVVGLISVDQVSLSTQISGFQGMTERYNLVRIGRINNHYCFSGTK